MQQLAVASVSLVVVAMCVGYVLSPAEEALGARGATIATAPGFEGVEGWVFSNNSTGFRIRIFRIRHHHRRMIASLKLGRREAFFYVHTGVGHYLVVFQHGRARLGERLTITKGLTKYFLVRVHKKHHAFVLIPLMFNY